MQGLVQSFLNCFLILQTAGACIGGGLDLIAACDIRLCTEDARFCLKVLLISAQAWDQHGVTIFTSIYSDSAYIIPESTNSHVSDQSPLERSCKYRLIYITLDCHLCAGLQEIDLAITADLGSLQRLPPLIGYGTPHKELSSYWII